MRGRKPLPSNLVRLRGNPGKRRLDDAEPVPAPGVPTCASCLGDEATKHPAGGLIILRDGDPGEPEQARGGLRKHVLPARGRDRGPYRGGRRRSPRRCLRRHPPGGRCCARDGPILGGLAFGLQQARDLDRGRGRRAATKARR